jgi:sugar-specific transcriptional regulator TrmB
MMTETEKMLTCKCKQCLKIVDFPIPEDKRNGPYPIILTDTHGVPPHKLRVYINKRFEIESFEIEEVQETSKASAAHISGQVLSDIGLTPQEIELYIHCTSLGPVSVGELSILINEPLEVVNEIAQKFVKKGLFKEIAGATQYYQALPPYAALLSQLDGFSGFIQTIKDDTPRQLQKSFATFEDQAKGVKNLKEFVTYITKVKTDVSKQLNDQKNELQSSLGNLLKHRNSLQQQLGSIQDKIGRNLEKLRLGVIQQSVQDVVAKSVSQESEVFQKSYEKVANIEDSLRSIFSSITTQFDTTLTEASKRIEGISDTVLGSFQDLRKTFSDNVIQTLDTVLQQIIEKLNVSNATVQGFWNEATRVISKMGKDVWFIRSPEGMRAQINEAVARAKMKVLILAPTISHLDVVSLARAPKFINIRISCFIDTTSPSHQKVLDQLAPHDNIIFRHRELKNLWGVSRDYEEVIVGVTSIYSSGGSEFIDVAAIGSYLPEHIKIFVPILEDAWMNSKKEIAYIPQALPAGQPEPKSTPVQSSSLKGTGFTPPPRPTNGQNILKPLTTEPNTPKPAKLEPVHPPTAGTKPSITSSVKAAVMQSTPLTPPTSEKSGNFLPEILAKLGEFELNVSTFKGSKECSKALENLYDFIQEKMGFHSALTDIHNWVDQLSRGFQWDDKSKDMVRKRIAIWRERLEAA